MKKVTIHPDILKLTVKENTKSLAGRFSQRQACEIIYSGNFCNSSGLLRHFGVLFYSDSHSC